MFKFQQNLMAMQDWVLAGVRMLENLLGPIINTKNSIIIFSGILTQFQ